MLPKDVSDSIVDSLERDLIGGRARWIADLNEFFRDYNRTNTNFNLYARGRTRNRGLFLSRFFSWTALPDYSVSLFLISDNSLMSAERVRRNLESVSLAIRDDELQWAWLIVLCTRELPAHIVSFVSRYDRREIGLAVASTASGQLVYSQNQLGRSIVKHLGLRKLLEKMNAGNTN